MALEPESVPFKHMGNAVLAGIYRKRTERELKAELVCACGCAWPRFWFFGPALRAMSE